MLRHEPSAFEDELAPCSSSYRVREAQPPPPGDSHVMVPHLTHTLPAAHAAQEVLRSRGQTLLTPSRPGAPGLAFLMDP